MDTPCERCAKPGTLCVCDVLREVDHRVEVLILQHPQEPREPLGTAGLVPLVLQNARVRVGLSWPNLKAALGREADPQHWMVLYLGSGIKGEQPAGPLTLVSRKGEPLGDQAAAREAVQGVVVLDGTWSQAKALWWRNAWLLKLKRGVLRPEAPSLYGRLRRAPRRGALSTLESVALTLTSLGEPPEVGEALLGVMSTLVDRARPKRPQRPTPRERLDARLAARRGEG